jgi:hypothetical protein
MKGLGWYTLDEAPSTGSSSSGAGGGARRVVGVVDMAGQASEFVVCSRSDELFVDTELPWSYW